ncbi:MAG: hypothetical protein RR942_05780 [Romboutsia sp.]
MLYNKYIQNIINIDTLYDIDHIKEAIYCKWCNKSIENSYYIDEYNADVYCSTKCYIEKIENDYSNDDL